MSEKQKERLEELFRLIKENPDLPILPMVDSEIVADDGYARWTASWGSAYVGEYIIGNERVYFKDEDEDEAETVLNDCIGGEDFYAVPEAEVERIYNELPWIKAIIVNIDLPEV